MKAQVLEKKTGSKMFVGAYGLFAHLKSMIITVGKHPLGNGDRYLNVRWTPTGFQPKDHEDDDIVSWNDKISTNLIVGDAFVVIVVL